MLKLFYKLIILFVIFFFLDFIFGIVLGIIRDKSPDGRYYKVQYSLEKGNEDIVIFGASRAEVDLVPYIFEDSLKLTCWNAGRGNQTLPFWICMQQGILNRYTPKIAIVDIPAEYLSKELVFEPAGLLRPFYSDHKEIRPILNKISFFERYFIYSNLYAYNSSFYYLLRPYLLKGLDGKREDKGWKPLSGQMFNSASDQITLNSNNSLNKETLQLFNEFVSNFTKKGCKVFFVISPKFSENIVSTSTIEYLKTMRDITLVNYDHNKLFTEDYHYYRDPDHLNTEGAIKFTKIIAGKIRRVNGKFSTPSFNNASIQ